VHSGNYIDTAEYCDHPMLGIYCHSGILQAVAEVLSGFSH